MRKAKELFWPSGRSFWQNFKRLFTRTWNWLNHISIGQFVLVSLGLSAFMTVGARRMLASVFDLSTFELTIMSASAGIATLGILRYLLAWLPSPPHAHNQTELALGSLPVIPLVVENSEPDRRDYVFRIRQLLRVQRDLGLAGLKWDDGMRSQAERIDELADWANHTYDLLQDAYGEITSSEFLESGGEGSVWDQYGPMVEYLRSLLVTVDTYPPLLPDFRFEHWEPKEIT